MRVLFVHPEDSPAEGPWSQERWDLIVDLGKSSLFSAEAWRGSSGVLCFERIPFETEWPTSGEYGRCFLQARGD